MCADLAKKPRTMRGVTMIEVLVGLVVGLLVSLAALISANTYMATQRQEVGVGSGAVRTAAAVAALKKEVAAAGLGFFANAKLLCERLNIAIDGTAVADNAPIAPVQITRAADNDEIDVFYATRVESGSAVLLATPSDGMSVQVRSLLPAVPGDAVLLSPTAISNPCTVRSATAVQAATDISPQTLTFAATGAYNAGTFTTAPAYPAGAALTLLGSVQWTRFRLQGHALMMEQRLTGSSTVLARNVTALRAQYGISDAASSSTTLAAWIDSTATGWTAINSSNVARLRAIRIGIVTRSEQPQKPDRNGRCDATEAMPVLFGNAEDPIAPDVSNWRCYRYATTTIVIPLRNVFLGTKP